LKKWFKWLIVPVLVTGFVGYAMSADNSRLITQMAGEGRTADYLVNNVYDSSTVAGYKMQRRVATIPLTTTSAGVDTVWNQLFTVPTGKTITITKMLLSSHLELDEATDSLHLQVCYYSGTAKATLDTAVAAFCIDNDSAIVYADTIYTMTLIDSVFTAGDIVSSWIMAPGGAISVGDGAAITYEYLLKE